MSDWRGNADLTNIIAQLRGRIATLERESAALPTYTLATRPTATAVKAGTAIFVSDEVDGQKFQGSDGTNWKTLG